MTLDVYRGRKTTTQQQQPSVIDDTCESNCCSLKTQIEIQTFTYKIMYVTRFLK